MERSIFVRPLSDAEREALEDGLRSKDAFVLRRFMPLDGFAVHGHDQKATKEG